MSNLEFLIKGVNLNKSYKVFRFSQNLAWTSGLCTRYSNNKIFRNNTLPRTLSGCQSGDFVPVQSHPKDKFKTF